MVAGNFVGPLAFKADDAPRYPGGFIIVLITSIIAAALVIVYRFVCIWENKKRDKAGTAEGFDHAYEDDLTDRKVGGTYAVTGRGLVGHIANEA